VKKLILFLGLLGACFFSTAQTIGLRGGLNFSQSITGMHLGVLLNLGQTEKLSNQFEVSFSQFGLEETDYSSSSDPEKLNYLKIGSAFKFHPVKNANFHIGPELGFQLNDIEDSDDFFRAVDFGIILGFEVFLLKNIGIGTRYYAGLHNYGNDDVKVFNKATQVSLIFLFNSKQLETFGH